PFVFTAVVVVYSLQQGPLSRLASKLKWLGSISYSIYLNHLVVLMLVDTYLGRLGFEHKLLTPAYLAFLLVYSRVTYNYIEVPGKQLLLRLGTLLRPSAANKQESAETQVNSLSG
ncbi:MAG: acyltransferase family protein, partial [Gammaproteobacteria bacterium]